MWELLWASGSVPQWAATTHTGSSTPALSTDKAWVILSPWNFCVCFGSSIIMSCSFCHHSKAHESGKLWNCWNWQPRDSVWLVSSEKSWWLSRALCIRHVEAWLGNAMLILWCRGPVSPGTPGQDWESLFSLQAGEGSSNTHIDPSVPVTKTDCRRMWPFYCWQTSLSSFLVLLTDRTRRKSNFVPNNFWITAHKPKVHGG